jgi:hypothetical protein
MRDTVRIAPGRAAALTLGLVLGLVLLTACSVTDRPNGLPDGEPSPPELTLNGVAGVPITWCRGATSCADGAVQEPADLPSVSPPLELQLAPGFRVSSVKAWNGERPDPRSVDVTIDGSTIGDVPEETEMISVLIGFENWTVDYYWRYVESRPAASGQP